MVSRDQSPLTAVPSIAMPSSVSTGKPSVPIATAKPPVQKQVTPIAASSSSSSSGPAKGPRSMVARQKELEARIAKNKAELEMKRMEDESRAAEIESRDESRAEMESKRVKDENTMVVDEPVAPVAAVRQKATVSASAKVFVPATSRVPVLASAKDFVPASVKVAPPAPPVEVTVPTVGTQVPVASADIKDAPSGSGHVDQRRDMEEKLRSLVLASKKAKSNVPVAKPLVEQPLETGKKPVLSPVVATSQVVNTLPSPPHQPPPPAQTPPRTVASSTSNTAPFALPLETKRIFHFTADTSQLTPVIAASLHLLTQILQPPPPRFWMI